MANNLQIVVDRIYAEAIYKNQEFRLVWFCWVHSPNLLYPPQTPTLTQTLTLTLTLILALTCYVLSKASVQLSHSFEELEKATPASNPNPDHT